MKPMNINKYTEKAQEAVLGAQQLAEPTNHPQIEPEHLLVALVEQPDGIVPELLRKMNVDPATIARAARERARPSMPTAYGGSQPRHLAAAEAGHRSRRRPRPSG